MHEQLLSAFRDELSSPTSSFTGAGAPPNVNFKVGDVSHLWGEVVKCGSVCILMFKILIPFAAFLFPYLAFVLILPGIREKRLISFLAISLQLGVGATIVASMMLPYWSVGEATTVSQFQSHSTQRHEATVGVNVGLQHLNITLKYARTLGSNEKPFRGLYHNERYEMSGVHSMFLDLQEAYSQGLPYPMLRILEYFSLSQGAFVWGREYRNAGHYTHSALLAALLTWLLQSIMLALVPHHFGKVGLACGVFILLADYIYVSLSPSDLRIPFASGGSHTSYIRMQMGSCFYASLLAGILSIFFCGALALLQHLRLYTISTCLSSTTMDDTVVPQCRWRGGARVAGVSSHVVDTSVEWGSRVESSSASSSSASTSWNSEKATEEVGRGSQHPKALLASTATSTLLSQASSVGSRSAARAGASAVLDIVGATAVGEGAMKSLDMLRKRRMQGRKFPPSRNGSTKPSVVMPSMSEIQEQARTEDEGWRENSAASTLEAHPSSGTARNSLISISTIGSAANLRSENGEDVCYGVEMTDDENEGDGRGRKKSLTLRI